MNAGALIAEALATAGVSQTDLNYLLADLMDCSPAELALLKDKDLTEGEVQRFWEYHERLQNNEPPQYILGKSWFYGLELEVGPSVLIPRPETEGLVELALSYLKPGMAVLEIGTGSGAISIALQLNCPESRITATEISPEALVIARKNAARHGLRIAFREADLFPEGNQRYDLIVSNPPYVSAREYQDLEDHIREYEPRVALLAEEEGLIFYRRILAQAPARLEDRGLILLEHGFWQRERILALAKDAGFSCVLAKQDLAGRDRYLLLQRTPESALDGEPEAFPA